MNVADLSDLALDYWVARSLHDFVREIYFTDSGRVVSIRGNDRGRPWDRLRHRSNRVPRKRRERSSGTRARSWACLLVWLARVGNNETLSLTLLRPSAVPVSPVGRR